MTKFRNAVLVAASVAFVTPQFVGGGAATSVESVQAQAGKVGYAPKAAGQ